LWTISLISKHKHWVVLLINALISCSVLVYFHNQFFSGRDEGIFSHHAMRILQGEVYGVDFYGVHPGYHSFLNALMFRVFGMDLVVLRYPLVFLGVLQSLMAVRLFQKFEAGTYWSLLAGIVITSLAFITWLVPAPGWYTLFFTFLAIYILDTMPASRKRLFFLGVIGGLSFMFRHPSGIFLASGIVAYLFYEMSRGKKPSDNGILGQITLGIIILGLSGYLFWVHSFSLFIFYGAWPIVFCLYLLPSKRINNAQAWQIIKYCGLGGAVAVLPMIIYQITVGNFVIWFQTSILGASGTFTLSGFEDATYLLYPFGSILLFFEEPAIHTFLSAVYWTGVYVAPFIAGCWLLSFLKESDSRHLPALVVVPFFYGYVSIYYQVHMYMYYSACLYILVIMYFETKTRLGKYLFILISLLSFTAIVFHAGQPVGSGKKTLFGGEREFKNTVFLDDDIAHIYVPEIARERHLRLKSLSDQYSEPDDLIFVMPNNPEFYFLLQRHNAFDNCCLYFTVQDEKSALSLREQIRHKLPRMIFVRKKDANAKNNYTQIMLPLVTEGLYEKVAEVPHIEMIEVYVSNKGIVSN